MILCYFLSYDHTNFTSCCWWAHWWLITFSWTGGIDLESCGQSQWPISTAARLCGDGGAGPLHLWPDVQWADAAQPGAVQVGASTHISLMFLWLAQRLRICLCFRDAVYAVGSAWCSRRATRELRSLAVLAFGVPSSWDEAQVSVLGNIIGNITFLLAEFLCLYLRKLIQIWKKKKKNLSVNSISWIGPLSDGLLVSSSPPIYTQELHPTHTTRKLSCKLLPPCFHYVSRRKQRWELMYFFHGRSILLFICTVLHHN